MLGPWKAAIRSIYEDVMRVVMRVEYRPIAWWDEVEPVDRRPLVRGLVASGAVR